MSVSFPGFRLCWSQKFIVVPPVTQSSSQSLALHSFLYSSPPLPPDLVNPRTSDSITELKYRIPLGGRNRRFHTLMFVLGVVGHLISVTFQNSSPCYTGYKIFLVGRRHYSSVKPPVLLFVSLVDLLNNVLRPPLPLFTSIIYINSPSRFYIELSNSHLTLSLSPRFQLRYQTFLPQW